MKGKYIIFEGTSGSGKDTQLGLTKKWLEQEGYAVDFLHEPTEFLRATIKNAWGQGIKNNWLDAFLFAADRAHAVETFLKPKLASGAIVLSSRSFVSSLAYQSLGEGAPSLKLLKDIHAFVPEPDLILIFDVPSDIALERIYERFRAEGKEVSRFEQLDKISELRARYKKVSEILHNCKLVNANRPIEVISEEIKALISALLVGSK